MSVTELWRGSLAVKTVTIVICLMLFAIGIPTLFSILGAIVLAGGCWMALRGGAQAGHAAAGISAEIDDIMRSEDRRGQVDPKMLKQAYSPSHGVAALFAGALVDYVINCVYIAMMLLGAQESLLYASRFASFTVLMPFWSILSIWHDTYTVLSPDIVLALMAGPFLIPLFQMIGYLQGPKLWKKTEEAMAQGRRRAKARSRIGNRKKREVRIRKPEI
ncbi:MAG: hypothetical protein E7317_11580 [Clostridiales bacterium]|nr:hypothetical protein [Clostridiales bacterium]